MHPAGCIRCHSTGLLLGGDRVEDHPHSPFSRRIVCHHIPLSVHEVVEDRRVVVRSLEHHEIDVSRADLLKVFMRPDEEIRQEVVGDVLGRMLSIGPDRVRATVRDGVVTVEGLVERRSLIPFLTGLVRGVDGVVGVEERLGYEIDDVSFRPKPLIPWGIYPRA
jgi:hypothetical protein